MSSTSSNSNRYLVFGPRGWIGEQMIAMLKSQGKEVKGANCRLENREDVIKELDEYKPTHALNCAGQTGRPNVDWCEDNKESTIRSNVIGTLNLADACWLKGVHMTNFATGCIFKYDDAHPMRSGKGFTEESEANFDESFYSKTKAYVEKIIVNYDNVLNLRLRMPVSDDLHSRNFVTKITKYERVVDIPNSNTLLHDLLPASILLMDSNTTGIYNFTNPGAISHNEVLALYKKYIKPDFEWKNFSLEEQAKVIKAGRSNCELDTTKLVSRLRELKYEVPEVHDAYDQMFQRMAKNMGISK
ncbi:NAD dependent epimerase/dehydratase [Protomyces lactucae-debilis]|uniref:NAD dependent epimerase/dehydratase n=1 Tax=Protomyces lactucae-debilis TaxID=2754530 RepID=A0A1Y2FQ96_PROLT|nr:NAD dependent epimerase/dehydratase [Protomyces lactucae-debilis]ORY86148.1 NAD dependent epimerase/dehydratase [Protomyces lactucae-debilis]